MTVLENNTAPAFITTKPETLVRELFEHFKKDGEWYSSLAEKHRCELLSEYERKAELDEFYTWFHSLTDQERWLHNRSKDFDWVLRTDEFGGLHKKIMKNDLIIHAFHLGYGSVGHSDDPNLYLIHLPGDEACYKRVYVVSETSLRSRLKTWTIEPIASMYGQYLHNGPLW